MLGQRRRRRSNINATLTQRVLSAGMYQGTVLLCWLTAPNSRTFFKAVIDLEMCILLHLEVDRMRKKLIYQILLLLLKFILRLNSSDS